MAKRSAKLFEDAPEIPDVVRAEAVTVPCGETEYILTLYDADVELLAQGVCPESVAKRCWGMLDWKREHARNQARTLDALTEAS